MNNNNKADRMNRLRFSAGVGLFLLSVFSAQARDVESNGYRLTIAPRADWVVAPPQVSVAVKSKGEGTAFRFIRIDQQTNLTGKQPTHFSQIASTAADKSALEQVSQISIQFNPEYESLVLHNVTLRRGDQLIDKLDTARIDLVRREAEMDRQMYDGIVTALIALPDVRVNDIVEYSYSISGSNPILGEKFSTFFPLGFEVPVGRISIRIVTPKTRDLQTKVLHGNLTAQTEERGELREIVLTANNVQAYPMEEKTVPGRAEIPFFQVTEYRDWAEVASWARGVFAQPAPSNTELKRQIEEWRGSGQSKEAALRRALGFVQEDVRYLGIEIGQSSHRPAHPDETFARRFGDCKDKTVLLATIFAQLGVKAQPALVSAHSQDAVADWLPTPLGFDHVITRAELDGKVYWLDGTRKFQYGSLDTIGANAFGKALVVADGTTALETIPEPPAGRDALRVNEDFAVASFREPVVVSIESTYTGFGAEWVRWLVADKSSDKLGEMLADDFQRRYASARVKRAMEVRDDTEKNALTLTESYEIPDFFSYDHGRMTAKVAATSLVPVTQAPNSQKRRTPFAMGWLDAVSHRSTIALPEEVPFRAGPPVLVKDPHFSFEQKLVTQGRRVSTTWDYKANKRAVAAAAIGAFNEKTGKVRQALEYSFWFPLVKSERMTPYLEKELSQEKNGWRKPPEAILELTRKFRTERAIATAVIDANTIGSRDLARAYIDRATVNSALQSRDHTYKDIANAIALAPDNAEAYAIRGEARAYSGEFEKAIADLDLALNKEMDPNRVHYARGQANYYLGKFDDARQDFEKSAQFNQGEELYYRLLWLVWNNHRLGKPASETLASYDVPAGAAWPGAALALYLGNSKPEDVLNAAKADKKKEPLNLCEAYFYIGQYYLMQNKPSDAKKAFEKSIDSGATMYIEYDYSNLELARMKNAKR
jgi:lipoprotein NlpI/transglutaminase-like putative cysteine protease